MKAKRNKTNGAKRAKDKAFERKLAIQSNEQKTNSHFNQANIANDGRSPVQDRTEHGRMPAPDLKMGRHGAFIVPLGSQ